MLVLFFHNFYFIPYSQFGWIGVDLFFVLSGFLITEILLRTREEKKFLKKFYIRRILRIFPLYYLSLFLFFMIAPYFSALKSQYSFYYDHQAMMWLYLQNWLFIFHAHPANNMLFQHFWSLAIEEQFYLIWPFVILICKNQKKLIWVIYISLASCILFRIFSWAYYSNNNIIFYLQNWTRIDGICVGSLIAVWKFNRQHLENKILKFSGVLISIHLLAIIIVRTILKHTPQYYFFIFTSVSAAFGIILVYALKDRIPFIKSLLSSRPLCYLGKISYGLYIFHYPVLQLVRFYLPDIKITIGSIQIDRILIIALVSTAIALFVSILSYHFFETKILMLRNRITNDNLRLAPRR